MKKVAKFMACVGAVLAVVVVLLAKQIIASLIGSHMEVQGVDVSHYQGDIDWNTLEQQGISFTYIKATEGSSYVDEKLSDNYLGVKDTSIKCGFYHFLSLESSAEDQMANFKAATKDYDMELIPAIDIEWYGDKKENPPDKELVLTRLREMVELMEKEYGVKPIVYTTQSYYIKYFMSEKIDFPLWMRNVYFLPFQTWTLWQYTDRAVMDGYNGQEKYIDRDALDEKRFESIMY